MGFRPARRVIGIRFEEGHRLHGLEIDVESLTFGEYLGNSGDSPPFHEKFVELVQRWNLEDEGGDILPLTVESLLTLDLGDILAIKEAWHARIRKPVSAPLGETSPAGEPSAELERSIPMESL